MENKFRKNIEVPFFVQVDSLTFWSFVRIFSALAASIFLKTLMAARSRLVATRISWMTSGVSRGVCASVVLNFSFFKVCFYDAAGYAAEGII